MASVTTLFFCIQHTDLTWLLCVLQRYDEVTKPANAVGGSNIPLTPAAALKLYMQHMTLYEQGEILDYPQVYFRGFMLVCA